MFKKVLHLLLLFVAIFAVSGVSAQILDPNDPLVDYDPNNPPVRPAQGQVGKWVRTKAFSWNTDDFKSYIYNNMAFRLRFPNNYDPNRAEKYPVILHLHGNGRFGEIYENERQLNIDNRKMLDDIRDGVYEDCFLLFPQVNDRWSAGRFDELNAILNYMENNVNIDPFRISTYGTSGGATAVWNYMFDSQTRVSATIALSGVSGIGDLYKVKHIPIWSVQGGLDQRPSPAQTGRVIDELGFLGGNFTYTLYEEAGHNTWNGWHFNQPDFIPFLLRHSKVDPWPLFEKREFCPDEQILVTIGVTAGFQEYQWRKDGVVIPSSNSHEITVTEAGIYDVRVRRNGSWSYWSRRPLAVGVKAPTVTPPIQVAEGYSTVIPAPDNFGHTILELPEGYEEYAWMREGSTQVLGTGHTLQVNQPGSYVASVKERFGCSSELSAPFSVVATNGTNLPSAPANVTAHGVSRTEVEINWVDDPNAAYNETGYEIYRSSTSESGFRLLAITAPDAMKFVDEGLEAGTDYFYVLRAINTTGASANSAVKKATTVPDVTAPTAPLVTLMGISPNSATLQWEASTDNVGVAKYEVFRDGYRVSVTTGTEAIVYNLQKGEFYNFTVYAVDLSGNRSAASNQVSAYIKESSLTYSYYHVEGINSVNQITSGELIKQGDVSYFTTDPKERNSNIGFIFTGKITVPTSGTYTFYTRTDDGSKLFINGTEVVNNDGNHGCRERSGNISLSAGVHDIEVSYYNGGGGSCFDVRWAGPGIAKETIPSSVLEQEETLPGLPPLAPSDLVLTAVSYGQVNLAWVDNSSDETGFEIQRSESVDGPYVPLTTTAANATSYEDFDVAPATRYYYRIRAIGAYGESIYSTLPPAEANWQFNNDYTDSSGNGESAEPVNGGGLFVGEPSTSDTPGERDYFIEFSGAGDYVELGEPGSSGFMHDAFSSRTAAFWMKADLTDNNRVVFDEGGSTNGMSIRINNNVLEAVVANGRVRDYVSTPFASTDWVHVAITFNNGAFKLYLDGTEVATNNAVRFGTVSNHGDNGSVGANNGSNAFAENGIGFKGKISDVIIFDSAISAAQVSSLAADDVAGVGINPAAYWKFDNSFADASGNGERAVNMGASFPITIPEVKEGSHALYINGSGRYVALGDEANGFMNEEYSTKTHAFWMKANDTANKQVIFEEGGSTNGTGIRINGGVLEAVVANGRVRHYASTPFTTTEWVHVAFTFDNGVLKIYLDGAEVAADNAVSFTTVSFHGDNAGLGTTNGSNAFNDSNGSFDGFVDDFVVHGSALNALQIQKLMTGGLYPPFVVTPALPTAPSAPSGLVATGISTASAQITWADNSANEDGFRLYRSVGGNTNFQVLAELTADVTTYTDEDLFSNSSYFYKVAAYNVGGESLSEEDSAMTGNNPPELVAIGNQSMKFGTVLDLSLYANDSDGGNLTFSIDTLFSFATFTDYGNGEARLTFSATAADQGTYSIEVTVTDANGGTDSETFQLLVNDNNPPVLASISSLSLNEGESTTVALSASDLNADDNLSWNFENLPAFVTVTYDANNMPSMEVAPTYADGGVYEGIKVTVEDGKDGMDTETFSITVVERDPNAAVYVNFTAGHNQGTPWNNVNAATAANLLDDEGNNSGMSLAVNPNTWKTWGDGAVTGNNSGVFPDQVIRGYYYFGIFGAPNTPVLTLSGLDANKPYKLSFLASSVWNGAPDNGETVFTVNGQSISLPVQGNQQNLATFTGIYPDANGQIAVNLSKGANTSAGYLNGFVVESTLGSDLVPAAARNLTASVSGASVMLSWKDAPYNEEGYLVYRSATENGTYSEIADLPANATSFEDLNTGGGAEYFYKVVAYNTVGTADDSNVASVLIPTSPPVLGTVANVSLAAEETATINVAMLNVPDGVATLTASNLPAFATLTDNGDGSGSISLAPALTDIGTYEGIVVTATDNQGSGQASFDITVTPKKLYSVYVNFTKNATSGAPWNNTSKSPQTGDVFGNLVDDAGNATGMNVALTTAWGGDYFQGATTGNNSGVVPDNVLREYYWFGIFNTPEQVTMTINGLDLTKKYNFKFVASSVFTGGGVTDNGTTVYSIGNKTSSVYAQGNTQNYALISGVSPGIDGSVQVVITKGANTAAGYLNAMIVEAFDDGSEEEVTNAIVATPMSRTEIDLGWTVAPAATSYEILRSESAEGTYQTVHTAAANENSYTDTGLQGGTVYFYKIRTVFTDSDNLSMATRTATISNYVYVNANGSADYDAGFPWNNFGIMPSNGDIFGNFKNDEGNISGIVMEFEKTFDGYNAWGVNTGNNSGVYPDPVMESFFFLDAPGKSTIKIKGLDQSMVYNLVFFNSIEVGFSVTTDFIVNGEKVVLEARDNSSNVAYLRGITADENNEALLEITSPQNWSIFNAMVIEMHQNPDPAPNGRKSATATAPLAFNKEVYQYTPEVGEWKVYPNPFVDAINLVPSTNGWTEDVPANIQVFDATGRLVLSTTEKITNPAEGLHLDLSSPSITNGLYLVKVKTKGQEQTLKVIKN